MYPTDTKNRHNILRAQNAELAPSQPRFNEVTPNQGQFNANSTLCICRDIVSAFVQHHGEISTPTRGHLTPYVRQNIMRFFCNKLLTTFYPSLLCKQTRGLEYCLLVYGQGKLFFLPKKRKKKPTSKCKFLSKLLNRV